MLATGVCKEFLHQEKHKGILSILFSSSHTWLHIFLTGKIDFSNKLSLRFVLESLFFMQNTQKKLATIDSVSVAIYDINQKLL